eukprot:scaffold61630_cov46-Attheya_sp.AAC.1
MFSRLEYYVELLNKLDLVPLKSFSDVPASCKYGMDEVGTDTTNESWGRFWCPPNFWARSSRLLPRATTR